MMVLVDTPIWSLALRRRASHLSPAEAQLVAEWRELVRQDRAVLLGIVRQEVLSGIASEQQYHRLRQALRAFADEPIVLNDYEQAAVCFNRCRAHGVQGSPIDFLICAIALRRGLPIFTTDADFIGYSRHLPIALHQVRSARS